MTATLIENQEEFNSYLRSLKDNERCKFMIGLDLDLCDFEKFECMFRGKEEFSLKSGMKKECRRERVLKLKKMLGTKNSHQ
jgi:hypothetical protein